MKKTFISISFACLAILFYSCSTDFTTIAPYKETMVIYGLVNPNENVQYIRISKAFLGEGNSLVMAQQKDSINYADVLDVRIQRLVNGNVDQTFTLVRDTTIEKNSGVFHSPFQVVYKATNPFLKDGSTYKLIVQNKQTGLTTTSVTNIIDDISNINIPTAPGMNFTANAITSIDFSPAANNGWLYNYTIRFHYKELDLSTNVTTSKYVDWNFGDQVTGTNRPTAITYGGIFRPDFYRIIGNAIPPADTNLIRRIVAKAPNAASDSTIELIFSAGTEDLYTYEQINLPSYGVVQDRPAFSNIENGKGLFTCRYSKSVYKQMDGNSIAALDTSRFTRNIHFFYQ